MRSLQERLIMPVWQEDLVLDLAKSIEVLNGVKHQSHDVWLHANGARMSHLHSSIWLTIKSKFNSSPASIALITSREGQPMAPSSTTAESMIVCLKISWSTLVILLIPPTGPKMESSW